MRWLAIGTEIIIRGDVAGNCLCCRVYCHRIGNSRWAVIFNIDGNGTGRRVAIGIGADYAEIQVDDIIRVRFIRMIQCLELGIGIGTIRIHRQGEYGIVASLTGICIAGQCNLNRNTAGCQRVAEFGAAGRKAVIRSNRARTVAEEVGWNLAGCGNSRAEIRFIDGFHVAADRWNGVKVVYSHRQVGRVCIAIVIAHRVGELISTERGVGRCIRVRTVRGDHKRTVGAIDGHVACRRNGDGLAVEGNGNNRARCVETDDIVGQNIARHGLACRRAVVICNRCIVENIDCNGRYSLVAVFICTDNAEIEADNIVRVSAVRVIERAGLGESV